MPTDYVIFVVVLLAVLGAGLLRVGLMNLKSEPPEDARKGRLFIAQREMPLRILTGWRRLVPFAY